MSMLAEKKKREKWSLNPRGKAWSEDQNKFGQRLMEKMGWKTGQGLGVNNQGVTDIVKTKLKNDSKGLGFKENGEEWLKTTSEFNQLLDELASSKEDSGDVSQIDTPSSLEDQSKKSRARVHYHKFTRGKDLSRYSDKDLASIIGPEVMKSKSKEGSTSDYTSNQVNRGNLEEYFSKKDKLKQNDLFHNSIGTETCNVNETKLNSRNKGERFYELKENPNLDEELEVVIPSKRKKKRKNSSTNENQLEESVLNDDILNSKVEVEQHNAETELSSKKTKKRKIDCDTENSTHDPEENNLNITNSALVDVLKGKSKKKKKHKDLNSTQSSEISGSVDQRVYSEAKDIKQENVEPNTEEKLTKKKKRKIKGGDSANNVECMNINSGITEKTVINDEVVVKKKKKLKDENQRNLEDSIEEEQTVLKKKVKKEKKAEKFNEVNETAPESEQMNSPKKAGNFLEVCGRKTRLKKVNISCNPAKDNAYHTEDFMSFSKTDECEKGVTNEGNTLLQKSDVYDEDKKCVYIRRESNSHDLNFPNKIINYESKLVLSKLKQLTTVQRPRIVITDAKSLPKASVKKLEQLHRTRYYKTFLSQKDISEIDAAVNIFYDNFKTLMGTPKRVKCKKPTKSKCNTDIYDENTKCLKLYREANNDDCSRPKHVVAYEYRLVTAKVKQLKITPPGLKVIIKESNTLGEATLKKLKQLNKIKHLKSLLPHTEVSKIEDCVAKFSSDLKPKFEIMKVLNELEKNIVDTAENLNSKGNLKQSINNKNEENVLPDMSLVSEKLPVLKNLSQKLETLVGAIKKKSNDGAAVTKGTLEKSSSHNNAAKNKSCNNVVNEEEQTITTESSLSPEDHMESECLWLKRVEQKLNIMKDQIKVLAEGKKPGNLNIIKKSKNMRKQNKKQIQHRTVQEERNYYHNASYSRGRIVHNVGYQSGRGFQSGRIALNTGYQRGRGVGRGHSRVKSAVPFGGWGILKSYGSGPEQKDQFTSETHNFGVGFNNKNGVGQERGNFNGRIGFGGQGRGSFRGRGRGDMRGRGRISQNNFDAKQYAEKCKELNKVPEICFSGVNLKVISGYAANVSTDKSDGTSNDASKMSSAK